MLGLLLGTVVPSFDVISVELRQMVHTRRQLLRWKMCRAFLKAVGMRLATSITYVGPAVDAISSLNVTCMRQRSLHDYCS